MSNVHNNPVTKTIAQKNNAKAGETNNNSGGNGSARYFRTRGRYEEEQVENYVDRSDYLSSALVGLATLNFNIVKPNKYLIRKMLNEKNNQATLKLAENA